MPPFTKGVYLKFTDRKDFLYDPPLFTRADIQTAAKFHDDYLVAYAGKPYSKFFEVERAPGSIDPLWNMPVAPRTTFSRTLDIPSIVKFDKANWALRRTGRTAEQVVRLWVSNLGLQRADYFPLQGDFVYYNGYRMQVQSIDLEPNGYWQQTNFWLGLIVVCNITMEGDAAPAANTGKLIPAEVSVERP